MKQWKIVRTEQADEDIIALWDYISERNELAADRLLEAIELRCQQLASQPFSGVLRPDISEGFRHLLAGRYLILYRVQNDTVQILRVLDGRRNLTAL